jgi:hypothetical protein
MFSQYSSVFCTPNRQIIAFKNLIEALENISIAMILALGFFVNKTLSLVDYRAFISTNSLSHEHFVSAKHFLQRDYLFSEDVEIELIKWYSDFTNHVMNTVQHGTLFANRHDNVYEPTLNNSWNSSARYLDFMKQVVLPRIEDLQHDIRAEIR